MVKIISEQGLLNLGASAQAPNNIGAQTPLSIQASKVHIGFSHADIQKMIINKVCAETAWLREYKTCQLFANANGTFTLEFCK